MASRTRHTPKPLWHPALWPSWFGIGCGWLLVRIPTRAQARLGQAIGYLFWGLAASRRQITLTNLRLCYPEKTEAAINDLARDVFCNMGVSVMESIRNWLGSQHKDPWLAERIDIEGLETLQQAQAQGRGVLLVGMHLMAMESISPGLARVAQVDVIYRYNKNPVIEWLMVRGRQRYYPNVIEREDTRAILASLKQGNILWYAADQDYGAKHSVFADFFGIPAATITGTARLAKFKNSPVVIMSQHRDIAAHRWSLRFDPGPESYPTGDTQTDAQLINDAIEVAVRRTPEQYLWLHKRFKTRPAGAPKIY